MNKFVKLLFTLALLTFSFLAGVKYSENVKNHARWLFEAKDEVELPDLSNENGSEIGAAVDENGETVGGNQTQEGQPAPAQENKPIAQ